MWNTVLVHLSKRRCRTIKLHNHFSCIKWHGVKNYKTPDIILTEENVKLGYKNKIHNFSEWNFSSDIWSNLTLSPDTMFLYGQIG